MEPAVLTLRFIFKAFRHNNAIKTKVAYNIGENSTDIEINNKILDLFFHRGTEYIADLHLSVDIGTRINFNFIKETDGGERIKFPDGSIIINKSVSVPLEITEVESNSEKTEKSSVRFKMNYFTYFGQNLYVTGSTRELGFWDPKKAVLLAHSGSVGSQHCDSNNLFSDKRYNWQGDVVFNRLPNSISYSYFCLENGEITEEPGEIRCVCFEGDNGFIEINDVWRLKVISHCLYSSSFFTKCILSRPEISDGKISISDSDDMVVVAFRASTVCVHRDRCLKVIGSIPELGSWKEEGAVELKPRFRDLPEYYPSTEVLGWFAKIEVPKSRLPFEYKYIAASLDGAQSIWELGENRVASCSEISSRYSVCFDIWHIAFPDIAFHGASMYFSYKSITSNGTTCKFSDIKSIGDWASRTGFSHIQVSDIFDTYAMSANDAGLPVSGYALDISLLDLSEYGYDSHSSETSVAAEKFKYIKNNVYPKFYQTEHSEIEKFKQQNDFWLNNYISLCYSVEKNGFSSNLTECNDIEYQKLVTFAQYLCYKDLLTAIKHCHSLSIAVGLDLPFTLSKYSAEAYFTPELFMKEYMLGESPSKSKPLGEVFDAYPFEMDRACHYFSEKARFFGRLFSALRLKDTISYFRQWIVPTATSVRAIFGRYVPSMGISCAELETWGLWDIEKYSQPFIREENLSLLFGSDTSLVLDLFFTRNDLDNLIFKPEFDDEVKLSKTPLSDENEKVRQKYLPQLLRLLAEVLIVRTGDGEYTPRPALNVAAIESGEESFAFASLPPYEQAALLRVHDEFIENKQRCLWAAHGRRMLVHIQAQTECLLLSDSPGSNGALISDVCQNLTILPFRVQTVGKHGAMFDDVRNFPFFSVASPVEGSNPPLAYMWDNGLIESKRLWEEELWESGAAPVSFGDSVSTVMIRQHCWSASMIVMFPIDMLIGSSAHVVQTGGFGSLDLEGFLSDSDSEKAISAILEQTKRKC